MDINVVRLTKLTPEERRKCAKEGLCFCCRKKGHMVSECPDMTKSPKKPRVQHAQKEEKIPKLEEIEDDDEEDRVAWVSFELDKDF